MPPTIQHLDNTGDALVATVEGQRVKLVTYRETLIGNGLVPLPPPFNEHCVPLAYLNIPDDEDSDLMSVDYCTLDREVACWMGEFAAGSLNVGRLR